MSAPLVAARGVDEGASPRLVFVDSGTVPGATAVGNNRPSGSGGLPGTSAVLPTAVVGLAQRRLASVPSPLTLRGLPGPGMPAPVPLFPAGLSPPPLGAAASSGSGQGQGGEHGSTVFGAVCGSSVVPPVAAAAAATQNPRPALRRSESEGLLSRPPPPPPPPHAPLVPSHVMSLPDADFSDAPSAQAASANAAPYLAPLYVQKLPHFKSKVEGCLAILPDTLAHVLRGDYAAQFDRVIVIDCRYEYEFVGGHIRGARNIMTPTSLDTFLFTAPQEMDDRTLIVFHCEFSKVRGPQQWKHIRDLDRKVHGMDGFPNLFYPEMYLLEGGYKCFFERFPMHCDPSAYVPMDHAGFDSERQGCMSASRRAWGKSRSGSRTPTQQMGSSMFAPETLSQSASGSGGGSGDDLFSSSQQSSGSGSQSQGMGQHVLTFAAASTAVVRGAGVLHRSRSLQTFGRPDDAPSSTAAMAQGPQRPPQQLLAAADEARPAWEVLPARSAATGVAHSVFDFAHFARPPAMTASAASAAAFAALVPAAAAGGRAPVDVPVAMPMAVEEPVVPVTAAAQVHSSPLAVGQASAAGGPNVNMHLTSSPLAASAVRGRIFSPVAPSALALAGPTPAIICPGSSPRASRQPGLGPGPTDAAHGLPMPGADAAGADGMDGLFLSLSPVAAEKRASRKPRE